MSIFQPTQRLLEWTDGGLIAIQSVGMAWLDMEGSQPDMIRWHRVRQTDVESRDEDDVDPHQGRSIAG